jgi:hypothetical protein
MVIGRTRTPSILLSANAGLDNRKWWGYPVPAEGIDCVQRAFTLTATSPFRKIPYLWKHDPHQMLSRRRSKSMSKPEFSKP